MKISELIEKLEREKEIHGDVLVGFEQEWTVEVGMVEFVPAQPTGFGNPEDGEEYVRDYVLLTSGESSDIFYRMKKNE